MTIVDDDSFHWVVQRVGMIGSFALIAMNAITIVVIAIFLSDTPSGESQNFLSLVMRKLDAVLFFAAFGLMIASGLAWLSERMRLWVRALLPWFLSTFVVSGLSWWVIRILESRGEASPLS